MSTSLKLVVLLCATAAVFALDDNNGTPELNFKILKSILYRDQSLVYNFRQPNDRILYYEYVDIPGGSLSEVKTKNITYPPDSTPYKNIKVTCIYVWDELKNGLNARFQVDVVKDDMGRDSAKIFMKSQPGQPINYEVTIHGFES